MLLFVSTLIGFAFTWGTVAELVLIAAFSYLNVWWVPRRALRVELAWNEIRTAPRQHLRGYTAAGRAAAGWALIQLACFVGGLLAIALTVPLLPG